MIKIQQTIESVLLCAMSCGVLIWAGNGYAHRENIHTLRSYSQRASLQCPGSSIHTRHAYVTGHIYRVLHENDPFKKEFFEWSMYCLRKQQENSERGFYRKSLQFALENTARYEKRRMNLEEALGYEGFLIVAVRSAIALNDTAEARRWFMREKKHRRLIRHWFFRELRQAESKRAIRVLLSAYKESVRAISFLHALVLMQEKNWERAEEEILRYMDRSESALAEQPQRLMMAYAHLARCRRKQRTYDRGAACAEKAVQIARKNKFSTSSTGYVALEYYKLFSAMKQEEKGCALLKEYLTFSQQAVEKLAHYSHQRKCCRILVDFYDRRDRKSESAFWRRTIGKITEAARADLCASWRTNLKSCE